MLMADGRRRLEEKAIFESVYSTVESTRVMKPEQKMRHLANSVCMYYEVRTEKYVAFVRVELEGIFDHG